MVGPFKKISFKEKPEIHKIFPKNSSALITIFVHKIIAPKTCNYLACTNSVHPKLTCTKEVISFSNKNNILITVKPLCYDRFFKTYFDIL